MHLLQALLRDPSEIGIELDGARLMQASSRRERQVRLGRGGTRVEVASFSGTVRILEQ